MGYFTLGILSHDSFTKDILGDLFIKIFEGFSYGSLEGY